MKDQPDISVPKASEFQSGPKSDKNGSKHPMLSISMAYNVISCKKNQPKHSKNQNRLFRIIINKTQKCDKTIKFLAVV